MKTPWAVEVQAFSTGLTIQIRNIICDSAEQAETIARLIAAAPELLWACKFVMKYHNMHLDKADGDELPFQLADAVRAAIEKAEGEK